MTEKEYLIRLGEHARKRHHHKTDKGEVIAFMQLEVEVEEGAWKPVVRYDCAHGFAHLDRYNLKREIVINKNYH